MALYKEIESSSSVFEKKLTFLPQTTLSGANLKFTKIDRTNTNDLYSNLFSSFNLPITASQKNEFVSGMYLGTAFAALNQDRAIVVEIPQNTYGEMIDGKSVRINIPTTNGNLQCYTSFFKGAYTSSYGNLLMSDANQVSKQFGQPYSTGNQLPGQGDSLSPISGYSSNVAYLFCDAVQRPANEGSLSWASSNKYFIGQLGIPSNITATKHSANFDAGAGVVDQPVGIVYLDKGFVVITHPALVNNFDYTTGKNGDGTNYSGDANFKEIYFNSEASITFDSFNTEFIQHALCFALPNEFYKSNNPTFVEAYAGSTDGQEIAVTEIGLYNESMELIAIAKLNQAVPKDKTSIMTFDIVIKV